MHVRIRMTGKPDTVVVVNSKLTKIEQFRLILKAKFNVEPKLQRLIYGGKVLENGYTFHDYNIKLNDVIQLMVRANTEDSPKDKTEVKTEETEQEQPEGTKQTQPEATKDTIVKYKDATSTLYKVGDIIDMRHQQLGSWNEGKIIRIVYDPDIPNIPDIKEMSTNGAKVLTSSENSNLSSDTENGEENKPPIGSSNGYSENIDQISGKENNVENKPPSESTNGDSDNSNQNSDKNNVENKPPSESTNGDSDNRNQSSDKDNNVENKPPSESTNGDSDNSNQSPDKENNVENKPPYESTNGDSDNSNQSSDKENNVENKPPSESTNGDNSNQNSYKNNVENKPPSESTNGDSDNSNQSSDKENNVENIWCLPSESTNGNSLSKNNNKDIASFFTKTLKAMQKKQIKKEDGKAEEPKDLNTLLLYKVEWNTNDEEASYVFCKLKDIRPRARKEIDIKDLKVGMKVMLNYNVDVPKEIGHWYDFQVEKIIQKVRSRSHELIGTIYLGPDAIPQNDTRLPVLDKIYAIEEVVPLAQRTNEYKKITAKEPEKRTLPVNCYTCRDNDDMVCKDCGCYLCAGKECPDKIILCDECDKGYHMFCLEPPLTEVPEEDWYCLYCKRDSNAVVAPGKAMQSKKVSSTSRDWGRGMACVGRTKDCSMPANHFGPIPGIEVGMCWRFRIQLSESGVHRPPVSGIHGRDVEGAYSLVLSGGYEDDVDNGYEFTYTGSGGRDLSGNKRTAEQSSDQKLLRENKALARNCAVDHISEEGGDAGENWQNGKPVRVVRSYKMKKHFPKYAPKEGIRYDGIYKVVKYYPETGKSGFRVWKYLLRRDDPNPAPWEPDVQEYPLVYPDGYLEAEAEKKALKEQQNENGNGAADKIGKKRKRRALIENNQTDGEDSPPLTKKSRKQESPVPKTKATSIQKKKINSKLFAPLSIEEKKVIEADTLNSKLWGECLIVCDTRGRKEFVEYVTQAFLCNICQAVAVRPVTTPCLHNFCMGCIKLACKSGAQCPCCRQSLAQFKIEPNEHLQMALRSILAGYDAGKK